MNYDIPICMITRYSSVSHISLFYLTETPDGNPALCLLVGVCICAFLTFSGSDAGLYHRATVAMETVDQGIKLKLTELFPKI